MQNFAYFDTCMKGNKIKVQKQILVFINQPIIELFKQFKVGTTVGKTIQEIYTNLTNQNSMQMKVS